MTERQGRGKRARRCDACRLPASRCICDTIEPIATWTQLVIVMHRNERLKSSNTAKLAARMIEGARVVVRGLPEDRDAGALPEGRRLVLFPGSHAAELSARHAEERPVVLLVPDGSWSQARKLVQRDELLQGCEAVRLPDVPASRYVLRGGVRDGTVCTFEAIAHALGLLEGPAVRDRMLAAFETFQVRALGFRFPPRTSARPRGSTNTTRDHHGDTEARSTEENFSVTPCLPGDP